MGSRNAHVRKKRKFSKCEGIYACGVVIIYSVSVKWKQTIAYGALLAEICC